MLTDKKVRPSTHTNISTPTNTAQARLPIACPLVKIGRFTVYATAKSHYVHLTTTPAVAVMKPPELKDSFLKQ